MDVRMVWDADVYREAMKGSTQRNLILVNYDIFAQESNIIPASNSVGYRYFHRRNERKQDFSPGNYTPLDLELINYDIKERS